MTESTIPELFFNNPLKLPLEKLYLKIKKISGGEEEVKALNKFWVSERFYPCYSEIPENDNTDDRDKWMKRAENLIKSLIYLLDLPFYKFWSHVVYEPAVGQMLDSFLKNAVPCYLPQPTGSYEEYYSQIYDLVFRVYTKILTPKQSETEYITPNSLGRLLTDNKIITNYILWDISKLYGHTDDGTLQTLLKSSYDIIPDLQVELEIVVTCLAEIFEGIGTAAYEEEAPTEKIVTKLTYLLFDTAFAINMFMKMYPPFKNICITENLISRIIHTYDSEVPILYFLMKSVYINADDPGFERVDNARVEMLETCHNLTSFCMDMILQNSVNVDEQNNWIEKYLKLITTIIEQHQFLNDFNNVFPIAQDIEILTAICPNIDQEKCNSIISTVVKQVEENKLEEVKQEDSCKNELLDEATVPENVVLDSKVMELLDMFPDLGDGFLEQCLLSMNLDSQAVTMAILEDNLPSKLSKIDRKLPRIPPEEPEAAIDVKAAFVGKKPMEHENLNELLNDKTHVKEQKERYLVYGSTTEDLLYDDDVDDRYEADYTAGIDRDDNEEILEPRRRGHRSEDEEPAEDNVQVPKNAFCEDPAVIRARREQRFNNPRRNFSRDKDVVGKPKGQGQDNNVQKNRENKNVHKSSRANHNRRQGAQWKRNRGMIPS